MCIRSELANLIAFPPVVLVQLLNPEIRIARHVFNPPGCHVTATESKGSNLGLNPTAEGCTARTADFLFVASEGLNIPHGSDAEDPDYLAPWNTSDRVSIRTSHQCSDRFLAEVAMKLGEYLGDGSQADAKNLQSRDTVPSP